MAELISTIEYKTDKMKIKHLALIILFISTIGLSTGAYFKYIKAFSDEKLQVETTNWAGAKIHRQMKLGEAIAMQVNLKTLWNKTGIEAHENDTAIYQLKSINAIAIGTMMVCILSFIWSIKVLRKDIILV